MDDCPSNYHSYHLQTVNLLLIIINPLLENWNQASVFPLAVCSHTDIRAPVFNSYRRQGNHIKLIILPGSKASIPRGKPQTKCLFQLTVNGHSYQGEQLLFISNTGSATAIETWIVSSSFHWQCTQQQCANNRIKR